MLAERAFMAERAQNTQVRRAGETHGPKLSEVVRERLSQREPDRDSVQWDSWRKDDGLWTIRMHFRIGGLPYEATWSFDPPRRLVSPLDDEARLLSSDVVADNAFPFTPRTPAATGPRLVSGAETGMRQPSVSALPTWHGQRPAREAGSRDGVVTPLRPAAVASAVATPAAPAAHEDEEEATAAAGRRQVGAGSAYTDALFGPVGPHKDRLTGQTDQQAVNDGVTPGKRATVPSWDEIVFGTRRRKAAD